MRHKFNESVSRLVTVFRLEWALSAINPYAQRSPFAGVGVGAGGAPSGQCSGAPSNLICSENAFNDPVQMPYVGLRLAYNGTGDMQGVMVALNGTYRNYRSTPNAGPVSVGIPVSGDINSYLVGAELVVPLTKQVQFSGEVAYGSALDVEFFRFGQGRNLGTGNEIRTVVGWGELDYAFDRQYTFIAGYGFDNPLNSDLRGTIAAVDQQYLLNHRVYVTAVRHIWEDLYASLEWNHMMTE